MTNLSPGLEGQERAALEVIRRHYDGGEPPALQDTLSHKSQVDSTWTPALRRRLVELVRYISCTGRSAGRITADCPEITRLHC